ncbi:unnamed protein product, partial [Ectocarpus sp. 8 AP-2014]
MSPSPDTQDSNRSNSIMASSGAPQQLVAQRAFADTSMRGGKEDDATTSNPYLAGLSKKARGLKKKMEKIKKTEALSASGKHLNEEQLKLLETKPLLEFALSEHERVKAAMEAVAKDEEEREAAEKAKLLLAPPPPPPPTGLSIAAAPEPEHPPAALSIPAPAPEGGGPQDQQPAAEVAAATESVGVSTDPLATEEAEVQTDVSGPPPRPGLDPREVSEAVAVAATLAAQEKENAAQEAEERGIAKGRKEAASGLSKVLRLLHVASRFEAKGERLPTAVDFFSKVLLGKTMPPDEADFDDCLGQSVERASLYLDPSNGSKEVAPGVSYATLDDMVSTLRSQIIAGPAAAAEGDSAAFNFFGEPSSGGGSSSKAEADGAATGTTPREAPPPPAPQPSNGNGNVSSFQPPAASARGGEELSGYQQQQQRPPKSPATSARNPTNQQQPQLQQQQEKLGIPMSGQVGPLGPPAAPPAVGIDVTPPPARSSPSLGHRGGGSQAPAEDLGLGSPTTGQLGRQASQMEEGILPPVASNQPSHLQQASPQQQQHQVDQTAFPKRERRPRSQSSSRGLAPSAGGIPPPSSTGNHATSQQPRHRHSELGSPPLRHLQQQQLLRSPFPQQPTPPLTPVQMGMGHGLGLSAAAPVPSPSPPGPNLPGPSRGSPNLTYGNNGGGWGGYAQPPPPPLQQ